MYPQHSFGASACACAMTSSNCAWEICIRGKASRVARVACAPVITRRTAVVAGASALVVAGCGGRPARLLAGDPKDLRILAAALDVEHAQVAFYETGVRLSDALI